MAWNKYTHINFFMTSEFYGLVELGFITFSSGELQYPVSWTVYLSVEELVS